MWCAEDVYIEDPMSLVQAYLSAARRHGVEVLESEPVVSVAMSGGRVTGVETAARSIAAPVVVDAAGADSRSATDAGSGTSRSRPH